VACFLERRIVTNSPARRHSSLPIDTRARTRRIAPRAHGMLAKLNARSAVSAPFLPEPKLACAGRD
jgi:hypothetical protein